MTSSGAGVEMGKICHHVPNMGADSVVILQYLIEGSANPRDARAGAIFISQAGPERGSP